MKFLRHESYKVGVALSTSLNVGAKGLAFVVNIVVAAVFGVGEDTDVYYYCLGTALSLVMFVTSVDASVLIPEIMRKREQESPLAARQITTLFFYIYAVVGAAISVIVLIDPVFMIGAVSGFAQGVLVRHVHMLYLFLLIFPLMILTTYFLDVLASRKMFSLPMLASLANNVVLILSIVLLRDRFGLLAVAIGLVLGYAFQAVSLFILLRSDLELRRVRIRGVVDAVARRNIVLAQVGNFSTFLSSYIPLVVLSGFGNGAVTALSYGQKLADVPSQVLTMQVSSVVGIRFNELAAKGGRSQLSEIYVRVATTLLLVLVPTSAFLFLNRHALIAIVFGRGAFDVVALEKTASFFQYLCFLAPFIAISTVTARLFMASRLIREALGYQIILSVCTVILTLALTRMVGATGYAIAILSVYGLSALGLRWLIARLFPDLQYVSVLAAMVKALGLSLVSLVAAWAVSAMLPELPEVLSVAVSAAVLYGTYVLMLFFVDKENEISRAVQWVLHQVAPKVD